jgi:F0F1-type ATP synthase assembly protein I
MMYGLEGVKMKDGLKHLALVTQVGLTLLFIVALFTILGVYLDRWLGTRAIFTLLFVLVGCASAMWVAVRSLLNTLPKDSEPK